MSFTNSLTNSFQKMQTSALAHHNYNSNGYNNQVTPLNNHNSKAFPPPAKRARQSPRPRQRQRPRPSTKAAYSLLTKNNINNTNFNQYLNVYRACTPQTPASSNISPPNPPVSHPLAAQARPSKKNERKCRRTYGMIHKELWCNQCKWKKACSRYRSNWDMVNSSEGDYLHTKHMKKKNNKVAEATQKIIKSLANRLPPTTTVTAATRTEEHF